MFSTILNKFSFKEWTKIIGIIVLIFTAVFNPLNYINILNDKPIDSAIINKVTKRDIESKPIDPLPEVVKKRKFKFNIDIEYETTARSASMLKAMPVPMMVVIKEENTSLNKIASLWELYCSEPTIINCETLL